VSAGGLNLARRPFVNGRPVTRVGLLLWLLGGLLLLGNVFVYVSYVAGTGEKRVELAKVVQQKETEQRTIAQLNDRFASLDLARQNEQVDFLNEKIAERTFSWSQLFDRLAKLMPADVRLTRLSPRGVVDTEVDRRRRGAPPPRKKGQDDRVTLAIGGEAKSDQALLKFVDNLFADPAFLEPDLTQQTKEGGGKDVIKFDLRVGYLPRGVRSMSPASPTIEPAPVLRRPLASTDAGGTTRSAGTARRSSGTAPVTPGVGVPGVGIPGVGVPRPPSPSSPPTSPGASPGGEVR
jgi:Tfp pilus assembly protein PilN